MSSSKPDVNILVILADGDFDPIKSIGTTLTGNVRYSRKGKITVAYPERVKDPTDFGIPSSEAPKVSDHPRPMVVREHRYGR